MVVKARSEKIYCEPFFKENCLFSSSLLEMVCNYELHLTMCIYGNLAYPLRVHLQIPFRRVPLTPLMQDYNEAMSALRISVEWLFGDVINSFKFLDYKKKFEDRP